MANRSLPDRVAARPLSVRADAFADKFVRGETPGTKGADANFGRIFQRAREICGLTQKDLAFRLGHADHTRVSKWEAGIENPQMSALFGVEGYRGAFMVALAEASSGQDIDIVHTITWRKRA